MFTGIVRERGRVAAVDASADAIRLASTRRDRGAASRSATRSPSTASASRSSRSRDGRLAFDAVPETLGAPTLGRLGPATRSTSSRRSASGEPLGGHYVQGHVDGVGTVRSVDRRATDVASGSTHRPSSCATRREGLGHRRRRLAHRRGVDEPASRSRCPAHARVTTLGALEAGDAGQPRGRRAREVRRAPTTRVTIAA